MLQESGLDGINLERMHAGYQALLHAVQSHNPPLSMQDKVTCCIPRSIEERIMTKGMRSAS